MVVHALDALAHLDHRGATGAEANVGDGAGILTQIPDAFFRDVVDFELPDAGAYAVGIGFLPRADDDAASAVTAIEKLVGNEDLDVLGWRDVPVDDAMIGSFARDVEPTFRQLFVAAPSGAGDQRLAGIDLDRRCFVLRKRIEHDTGVTSRRCRHAPTSTRGC